MNKVKESTNGTKNPNEILWEKISEIKIAMMVSVTPEGGYHSRPMMTSQKKFDGRLYFFTSKQSAKVDELLSEPRVLLNYSGPEDSLYVSVYGTAKVLTDSEKIDEHWSPVLNAYFEEGKDDPKLCLIEIEVERAEYWDSTKSKMMQVYELAKAALTDSDPDLGKHEKLSLKQSNQGAWYGGSKH